MGSSIASPISQFDGVVQFVVSNYLSPRLLCVFITRSWLDTLVSVGHSTPWDKISIGFTWPISFSIQLVNAVAVQETVLASKWKPCKKFYRQWAFGISRHVFIGTIADSHNHRLALHHPKWLVDEFYSGYPVIYNHCTSCCIYLLRLLDRSITDFRLFSNV